MKKVLSAIVLLITIVFLSAPILVFADEQIPNCCRVSRTIEVNGTTYTKGDTVGNEATCNLDGGTAAPSKTTKDWGLVCLLSTVGVIADWIFTFSMAIVIIFVVMGAFFLVTSTGDAQKVTKGRNYILYAAVGMIVALLAKAVPALVKNLLG